MNHHSELTTEEKEMLKLYIVEGLTLKEVADKQNTTQRAIEKRVERVRVRFGCINIRQLTFVLIEKGAFSVMM